MKILITGPLGHIGSKLIRELPNKLESIEIFMIDNMTTQRYCSLFDLPKNVKYNFIESDIKKVKLDEFIKTNHIDSVIHLAAITDASGTADNPSYVFDNNFNSTKIVADACFEANISIIFPSSTSVYGSQSEVVDETCDELKPQSPYAECKIKEESYILELIQKGLKGVICRFGTIYGTSPGIRFHTAVNKFCWQAVMEQPISVWETALHQKRPYLNLDDCCKAIAWILKNKLYSSNIYNIVSHNLTVNDVIEEIKQLKPELKIEFVKHRIMNQLSYEVLPDKFCKTGFKFEGSIAKGISDTINLFSTFRSSFQS